MTDREREDLIIETRRAIMAVQMPASTLLSERVEIRRLMRDAVGQAIAAAPVIPDTARPKVEGSFF